MMKIVIEIIIHLFFITSLCFTEVVTDPYVAYSAGSWSIALLLLINFAYVAFIILDNYIHFVKIKYLVI